VDPAVHVRECMANITVHNASTGKGFFAMQFTGVSTLDSGAAVTPGFASASPVTSTTFSTAATDEIIVYGLANYYASTFNADLIGGVTATIPTNASLSTADGLLNGAVEFRIAPTVQTSITADLTTTGKVYAGYFSAAFH